MAKDKAGTNVCRRLFLLLATVANFAAILMAFGGVVLWVGGGIISCAVANRLTGRVWNPAALFSCLSQDLRGISGAPSHNRFQCRRSEKPFVID